MGYEMLSASILQTINGQCTTLRRHAQIDLDHNWTQLYCGADSKLGGMSTFPSILASPAFARWMWRGAAPVVCRWWEPYLWHKVGDITMLINNYAWRCRRPEHFHRPSPYILSHAGFVQDANTSGEVSLWYCKVAVNLAKPNLACRKLQIALLFCVGFFVVAITIIRKYFDDYA